MARWTKKDECKALANYARQLRTQASDAGREDLEHKASCAESDAMNANECLLSSSVADKKTGGGGSSDGWALRREAKGLMVRANQRTKEVREALDAGMQPTPQP